MIEKRYCPIEYRAAAGTVEGTAVDYTDAARIPGPGGGILLERIQPAAFGSIGDVVLNSMHDRQKPLARTGGGGLVLDDGPEALRARIELPDTTDGRDARILLNRRVLRGLSVEMRVRDEEFKGRERIISRADLCGLALVDRPAYSMSVAALKRWSEVEDRAAFSGSYEMDQAETISDTPGRGQVRKRKFSPGAFRESIEDPAQEIGLLTSRNPNDAIASKRSGTLAIEQDGDRLNVTALNVADTAAWRDLLAKRDAGLVLALQPIVKADSGEYEDIPEDPSAGSALVRTYTAAKLLGFMVTARPPKGATASTTELTRWVYELPLPV